MNENQTAVITVTAPDADMPVQTVTFSITGGFDAAHFSINSTTGDLVFNAAPDFESPTDQDTNNVYEVDVTADDGNGAATVQSLLVTVNPVNEAPTGVNDAYAVGEDGILNVAAPGVVGNDTDPDAGNVLVVQSVDTTVTMGSVVLNPDGSFSYDPNGQFASLAPGQSATDSFRYTVTDGNGGTDTATVTITINGANDAPIANNDNFDVIEGDTLVAGVLANDSDAEGDPLTASLVSGPTNGTFSFNADGSFTYTPNDMFLGTDSFTYRAGDGVSNSNLATVTITVLAGISPPSGEPPSDDPGDDSGDDDTPDDDDTSDDDDPDSPSDGDGEPVDGDPDGPGPPGQEGGGGTGGSSGDNPLGPGPLQDQPGIDIVFPETVTPRDSSERGSTERDTVDTDRLALESAEVSTSTTESTAAASVNEFAYLVPGSPLWDDLDAFDDQMQDTLFFKDLVVGSALTASTGLTVGYVVWMIRGGMLLSSLIAQMPAWRLIDPLVVLSSFDDEALGEEDGDSRESLASLVEDSDNRAEEVENTPEPANESQA